MIEWIKSHRALAIGGIVALVLLVYVLNHSSSAPATDSGGSSSDVAAATALQNAQLQAASQANQINASVSANATNTAAQLELGKLSIAQAGAHDQLAAQVETSNINASQQLQSLLATLSANVATTQSNNDVAKQNIVSTNATQQQQILANALVTQSGNQAEVAEAAFAAQTNIASNKGGLFGGGGFLGTGIHF